MSLKPTLTLTVLVTAIVFTAFPSFAEEPKQAGAKADNPLVGTWKVISAKYSGQEVQRPEGHTHLKHVTPTQFMWAIYDKDGKVEATLGGSYLVKGDQYVE